MCLLKCSWYSNQVPNRPFVLLRIISLSWPLEFWHPGLLGSIGKWERFTSDRILWVTLGSWVLALEELWEAHSSFSCCSRLQSGTFVPHHTPCCNLLTDQNSREHGWLWTEISKPWSNVSHNVITSVTGCDNEELTQCYLEEVLIKLGMCMLMKEVSSPLIILYACVEV